MGRRRRTLLNAPTGRTHTAPPARQRDGAPVAASDLSYTPGLNPYGPSLDVDDDLEDDIPTEVAPRPFDKDEAPENETERPDEPATVDKPVDDMTRPAKPPTSVDERLVPGLVMVGFVGLVVIALMLMALLTR